MRLYLKACATSCGKPSKIQERDILSPSRCGTGQTMLHGLNSFMREAMRVTHRKKCSAVYYMDGSDTNTSDKLISLKAAKEIGSIG